MMNLNNLFLFAIFLSVIDAVPRKTCHILKQNAFQLVSNKKKTKLSTS
jgi:hypothetical protein